ncbi:hypothetical protein AK812_SmicGene44789 [Symbiodinium microadriaticum]|uniref:Uncharacterized protein n=1 Tax=Symbiodinium microadriaticum TaxID=2951 RepID=A0A1Q9BXJ1_SYMMI|nr:hypothetical protein AK812_SmicGene44789 [Symbiodinium microadriaticum]
MNKKIASCLQGAEGQPAAARSGGGLVPRALGALALRRPNLRLPDLAAVREINERENRQLAPADALVVQYEARGAVPTNAPQTMRVWPGLRLIGAGGKVQKGTFLTVEAVEGDVVRLESGQSFAGPELLKHTRLCGTITYASVQGLTLRGRVWLYDVESPRFTLKHLYMGCSRATNSELLSVRVEMRQCWLMPPSWGILMEVTDLTSLPSRAISPCRGFVELALEIPEIAGNLKMDERSRAEILKYFYLRAGGSFRELQLLLENAAKANASDALGIKARIDKWYEKKIQPIKDVLAETEGWLDKLFRELWGEKKPKKEPKSKYLDYVTKVAEAGPIGYLSGSDALKKETELEMELRRLQPAQAILRSTTSTEVALRHWYFVYYVLGETEEALQDASYM